MGKLGELFEHVFLLVGRADVNKSLEETQQLSHVGFELLLILLVIYVRFVNKQLIIEARRNQGSSVDGIVFFLAHVINKEPKHRLEKGQVLNCKSEEVKVQIRVLLKNVVISDHHSKNLGHKPLLLSEFKVVFDERVFHHTLGLQRSRRHQTVKMCLDQNL